MLGLVNHCKGIRRSVDCVITSSPTATVVYLPIVGEPILVEVRLVEVSNILKLVNQGKITNLVKTYK